MASELSAYNLCRNGLIEGGIANGSAHYLFNLPQDSVYNNIIL